MHFKLYMYVRLASTPKTKHLYLCEDHQHYDTELLFVHMCISHSPFAVVQNFLSNLTSASDFKILFFFFFFFLQNSSCLLTNASPPSAHHIWGQLSVGEGVWKAKVDGTVREGQVGPPLSHPMSLGSWETDVWPGRSLSSVQPPAESSIQGRPGLPLGPASEYEWRPGPAEGGFCLVLNVT